MAPMRSELGERRRRRNKTHRVSRESNETTSETPQQQQTEILVCFRMYHKESLKWSIINISSKSLRRLNLALRLENHSFEGTRTGFHLCYTEHQHYSHTQPFPKDVDETRRFFTYSPVKTLTGPTPVTHDWCRLTSSAVVGSTIYCLGADFSDYCMEYDEEDTVRGICHMPQCCDLSAKVLHWKMGPPLLSPRLSPNLVSFDGKLFVFGGNSGKIPFAEVYDPCVGHWKALPRPPFLTIHDHDVFVIPLGSSTGDILIVSPSQYIELKFNARRLKFRLIFYRLPYLMRFIEGHPVGIDNTVYWFEKSGMLCAFDFDSGAFFRGPIVGDRLEHTKSPVSLLAIEGFLSFSWIEEISPTFGSLIHLTILSLSMNATSGSLTAYVVACFCHWGPHSPLLQGAYLMGKGI